MTQMLIVHRIEIDYSTPDFTLNFFRLSTVHQLCTCNTFLLSESIVPANLSEQKRRYEIRVLLLIKTTVPVHSAGTLRTLCVRVK